MKRGEIDTSAPFRSVKEAVLLFGERVSCNEVHEGSSNSDHAPSRVGLVKAELEETKESLQKAKQQTMLMSTCLSSLEQELELTKRELRQLKQLESRKQVINPEIEHVKFVQDSTNCEFKKEKFEFQKKRYVTFGQVVVGQPSDVMLKRHPSLKKKKKNLLIPLIGGIFSKKKSNSEMV